MRVASFLLSNKDDHYDKYEEISVMVNAFRKEQALANWRVLRVGAVPALRRALVDGRELALLPDALAQ